MNYRFSFSRFLNFTLLLSVLLSSAAFAGNTGKISGKITDAATNETIPGINVIIENTAMGASSDENGNFIINNIPPGLYSVRVSGIGYQTKKFVNIRVSADFTTRLDVQLSSDIISTQEVVIQAESPMVRKDLTSSQASVDASQIETLPVESVDQILSLQAGIIQGAGGELHIKGGRSSEISYNVNGVSISNPFDYSRSVEISTNAIQELSVVSGTFNAEYGNALSGIINSVTKEGGNKYSGSFSAYSGDYLSTRKGIFYNIDNLNAFNNYVAEFTLGGPVPLVEDKFGFFISSRYNYDGGYLYGIRQHTPGDYVRYQNTDSMLVAASGDNKIVPMNSSRDFNATGKLTFKPISTIKINYDVFFTNSKYQFYNHALKYNPDANYNRYEMGLLNSIEAKHALNKSTFYSLKGSYNINDFKRYLYPLLDASGKDADFSASDKFEGLHADPRYQNRNRIQPIAANTFASGGTQNEHSYQKTETAAAKFDLTSQININHEVKLGAEYKLHTLRYRIFQVVVGDTGLPYIPGVSSSQHDYYKKVPTEFSAYIQDKMEFESMILNAGIRYDYFDANADYSTNRNYPSENMQGLPGYINPATLRAKAGAKHQISPRIGISFPITDRGIIHFSYGHFFQIPPFRYLYSNPDFKYELSGTPLFGNANLNPEKTITYEIGLQQQLSENLAFDITGYVKDVRDLLALQEIRISSSQTYQIYVNKDYANIKGVTFSLTKRRNIDEFFGASIDYTYQTTEGSDTRSDAAFLDLNSGRQSEKVPYYLDWDQPHTLNATLNFGYASDWNITLVGRLGAGLPYTPRLLESQVNLRTNSARKPSQITVDLLADKTLRMFGFNLTVFLKVFNLFDTLNENDVYNDTGRATYTLEKQRGTTDLADRYASQNPLIKPASEYFVRPDYYLAPREVRAGLSLEF